MNGDKSAQNGFYLRLHKACFANHALKVLHVGEAADRFDEVSIAVLITRNGFAELRDKLVRIDVVNLCKPRPFNGRKFEAEEAATITQHAMCLAQRLGNVGDVADAKGNCVGIKMRIGKAERFSILRGPDQAVDPALHRALHTDVQHVFINVGYGDLRA